MCIWLDGMEAKKIKIGPPLVNPTDLGAPCSPWFLKRDNQRLKQTNHRLRNPSQLNANATPVIIVPGYSGTKLDAILTNASLPDYCKHNADRFRLWLSWWFLDPFRTKDYEDCWYRMAGLSVQTEDDLNIYQSPEGVKILPVEYMGSGSGGGTKGCDYILDVDGHGVFSYFGNLIEKMESNLGYVRGKNLRAASFDWRFTPDYLERRTSFVSDFINLILQTYSDNGNKPVIIIAHSMGNLIFTRFINSLPNSWTDKYIKYFISVSAPWTGTTKSVRDLLSGDSIVGNNWYNRELDVFDRKRVLNLAQGYGSITYMLPSYNTWKEFPLIHFMDINKNFTGAQLEELLIQSDRPTPAKIYSVVKEFNPNLTAPRIDMLCIGGTGIPTEKHYVYMSIKNITDQGYPQAFCTDGDGTLVVESLRICKYWKDQDLNGGKTIDYKEYPGRDHIGILSDDEVIQDLINLLKKL